MHTRRKDEIVQYADFCCIFDRLKSFHQPEKTPRPMQAWSLAEEIGQQPVTHTPVRQTAKTRPDAYHLTETDGGVTKLRRSWELISLGIGLRMEGLRVELLGIVIDVLEPLPSSTKKHRQESSDTAAPCTTSLSFVFLLFSKHQASTAVEILQFINPVV